MDQILKDIADFVDQCLGPLGNGNDFWGWLRDFCIQLIATFILFLVVKIFLWKPITSFLEARRNKMDQDLLEAEEAKNNAIKLQDELQEKLNNAKEEIQALLKQAESQGNARREEIVREAKEEATRIINMANEDIKREVKAQEDDIKKQIIQIAFLAAEAIVGSEIDQEKYLQTVTSIIESGTNNG